LFRGGRGGGGAFVQRGGAEKQQAQETPIYSGKIRIRKDTRGGGGGGVLLFKGAEQRTSRPRRRRSIQVGGSVGNPDPSGYMSYGLMKFAPAFLICIRNGGPGSGSAFGMQSQKIF
jgi:hypothetical protein